MTISFAGVAADAWALFRRDAGLLLRIAGAFLFLPAYAVTLLVPPMPQPDGGIADAAARAEAWSGAIETWVQGYGLGFFIAYAIVYFGVATILSLYADPDRPDLGGALKGAVRLYPRFLGAMILVSVPAGLGMWLLLIPGLYVLGRTMPTGTVIVAERPIGIWRAIRRALALTRGNGVAMLGLVAVPTIAGMLAGQPLLLLDTWLRGEGHGNPVGVAIADAGAAGVAMATQLALTLIAVAAYRRLAR